MLKILMPFDLKSSSKPVAEQRMLFRWEVLDRFMVQSLVSNLILEILHFFFLRISNLLLYFYLLVDTSMLFTKKLLSKNRGYNFSSPFNSDIQIPSPSNKSSYPQFCYHLCSIECGGQYKKESHCLQL